MKKAREAKVRITSDFTHHTNIHLPSHIHTLIFICTYVYMYVCVCNFSHITMQLQNVPFQYMSF